MLDPVVAMLDEALDHMQAGRPAAAEVLCHRVLATEPDQTLALHMAGVAALRQGRAADAAPWLRRAVALRPDDAALAVTCADACAGCGAREEAIGRYRAVLGAQPGHLAALVNLANALRDSGDAEAAITTVEAALARAPALVPARITLGSALLAAGRVVEAAAAYRAASQAAPENAVARAGLAMALLRCGRAPEALAHAVRATELWSGAAEIWFVLGSALNALQRPGEAIDALQRALALDPAHARAWLNLGNALADLDRVEEAERCLRTALSHDPSLPEAHASLGWLLSGAWRLEEATAACEMAIRLRPDFAQAHWNLSFARLLAGDYERGWEEFEWRKRHDKLAAHFLSLPGPEWQGEPPDDRTLLVRAEQGLGDAIQFARFLPGLAASWGRVIFACDRRLIPLLSQMPVSLVDREGPLPQFDLWVDQMSLPRVLGTRPEAIPLSAGYLGAPPEKAASWKAKLGPGRHIGIVWAGNPAHSNDFRRSMRAQLLAPLLAIPGAHFISLQVGPASGDITRLYGLPDNSAALTNFTDTAALVASLDLVIAVDTSTAHLAGAMGVPVWVMLPRSPDWRWMTEREDTPWYASMRLFRQSRAGDWEGVVARVAQALTLRCGMVGGATTTHQAGRDQIGAIASTSAGGIRTSFS